MAANSAIEWTDQTWNPVIGCEKVSPGCAHCYAEVMAARIKAMALADIAAGRDPGRKRYYIDAIDDKGRWTGKLIPVREALDDPHGWRKPRQVFVNSMSDLFHESVPELFIESVFGVMSFTERHTYQVLTKRPERMLDVMRAIYKRWKANDQAADDLATHRCHPTPKRSAIPLGNVWLGASAENQHTAINRHRSLMDVPAAVRFWSLEPLLGPIDALPLKNIGWVIVGGESGHDARPCRATWIRDIVRQCADAGVPCFVKQLGANAEEGFGVHRKLRLEAKKGGDMAEWPEDLRIRQFPESAHVDA